ncbi:hypothetical protein ACLBWS_01460 [Brucellaceae bacterium D45D]
MDFISWILSIIGIGNDRAIHTSNQRAELARLNAEVASEIDQAITFLESEIPRLKRRCALLSSEYSEVSSGIIKLLDDRYNEAVQLKKLTKKNHQSILNKNYFVDWDKALIMAHEWRGTASRIVPWTQDIIMRLDQALNDAGIQQ